MAVVSLFITTHKGINKRPLIKGFSLVIYLPTYLSGLSALVAASVCQQILNQDGVVDIDAQHLRFADPFGIAMLGACFHGVKARGQNIRVHNLNSNLGGYLQRMDLFNGIELIDCAPENGSRQNRGDALVELTMLSKHSEVGSVAHKLAVALVGGFADIDPNEQPDEMTGYTAYDRLVEPLQYALNELLENALTHARRGDATASVWVASQYYPKNGLIRLGVVDNGCGFLESLRNHAALEKKRHLDAILLALRPRISCNRNLGLRSDTVNQGVGLTTSCRIAEHAGGKMILVSGNAMHNTSGSSGQSGEAYWQGVGIAIECKRSKLSDIRFRELLPPLDDIPAVKLRFEQ